MPTTLSVPAQVATSVEHDEETWKTTVFFRSSPLIENPRVNVDGLRCYAAHTDRDETHVNGVSWVVPPNGDVLRDGALVATPEYTTPRTVKALAVLTAKVRALVLGTEAVPA